MAVAAGDALADGVVTTGSLAPVPSVFETTNGTHRRVRENLGWAFFSSGIAVPLAMATSSLLVVATSTRPVN